MKKFLAVATLLLTCTLSASAQGARTFATTVVAADVAVSNAGSGIAYHLITWTLVGSAPTCQVKLEKAAASTGPWTDLIAAQACTSNGQSAVVNAVVNFIRINVTVKSGTGSVSIRWNGYIVPPSGGGTVTSITGTSPIVVTPNPITGAGAVSCPTCSTATTLPFSSVTGATNSTAAMVLGTGASLTVSGSGTNNATTLNGATFAAPGAIGSGTPAAGTFTTLAGTTINGMTVTASTGTYTLANGKTFAVNNGLTLAGTDSTTMTFPSVSATIPRVVCAGSFTFNPTSINPGASQTITQACTGLLTTDNMMIDVNGSPLAVTGYAPNTAGGIFIYKWPSADTINVAAINNTASAIDPGSLTLNYLVIR